MVRFSEQQGERAIALALRYGSLVSTAVIALGLGLMLGRGQNLLCASVHSIRLPALFPKLIRFDPAAVIELGVLLLLLTPLFRIVVAGVSFALEGDLKFVLISLGVLLVVLLSISYAIGA
jgi:uncharacterized membrane protein